MNSCFKKYIFLVVIILSISTLFCDIDSLLTQLEKVEKKEKITTLFDIAYEYAEQAQFDKALDYSEQALYQSRYLKSDLQTAEILYFLGYHGGELISNEEALEGLWEAADIFEENDEEERLAWVYNQIGVVYESLYINEKALMYYNKAQAIFEKMKDESSLGGIYNNLGNMYSEMNDEEKALESYNISVEANKKYGNIDWAAASLFNISIIYSGREEFELSIQYLEESLELYESIKDTTSYFSIYISMADGYAELKNFDKAYESLRIAESYMDRAYHQNPDLEFIYQTAFINFKEGLFQSALEKFLIAENLAKKYEDPEFLSIIKKRIGDCYAELGLFEYAHSFIKEHMAIEDSLRELDNTALLIQKQKEYEMDKFQDQMHLEREKEKIKSRAKILEARLIGWLLLLIVVALILAIYLFYRNSRLQKKNNQILQESNNNKNKLISILSHDMKNTLYSIKSGTRILAEEVDRLEKNDIKMFAAELNKSTENVYNFMENILLWMKSQADKLDVINQEIKLYFLVEKIFELFESSASAKEVKLVNNVPNEEIVHADKDMLDFIVRNLVQNAIKYSLKNGMITITSRVVQDKIEISVKDDGIGIPADKIETLFSSSNRFSRKGTSNEKGTGLGLVICNEFAHKMKGSISCKSIEEEGKDRGSCFIITLPNK